MGKKLDGAVAAAAGEAATNGSRSPEGQRLQDRHGQGSGRGDGPRAGLICSDFRRLRFHPAGIPPERLQLDISNHPANRTSPRGCTPAKEDRFSRTVPRQDDWGNGKH